AGMSGDWGHRAKTIRSEILQVAADSRAQIRFSRRALRREITRSLLRFHFDLGVVGNHLVRYRDAFDNVDSGAGDRVVFHVGHRYEAIDLGDAEPLQHIRHQLLETRILHACNAFGAFEIGGRLIAAGLTLSRVVDEEFRDLAERAAFL